MNEQMPKTEALHEVAIPVKEASGEEKRHDEGKDNGGAATEEHKGRQDFGPALMLVGALVIAVLSLVTTQLWAFYAKHSTHMLPLKPGQAAAIWVLLWAQQLWVFLHATAAVLAAQCSNFCQGYRHHRSRLMSDEHVKYLNAFAEFGILMLYFYLCDRTDLFNRSDKVYNRDLYWFIWLAVLALGIASIEKVHPTPSGGGHVAFLQRDQTEEWKGWMQIQFLMYHYFNAKEYYNAIRCYIAAYVWMTGFGNFSFYYVKRDFSLQRFFGMQWRLNFFVFWCCLLLSNDYMLYYICMLHTTFTVFIYVGLGVWQEANYTYAGIRVKFLIFITAVVVIWNVPGVFGWVWAPLRFLVDYQGSLHEWAFRSKLDHFVWIPGMLTAFTHPNTDGLLEKLDAQPFLLQYSIKATVVVLCLLIGAHWYSSVFSLGKFEYNQLHPYTSFVPITLYIVLRNISSRLRRYHMGFFAWMGKITLETYICQFHIWMVTTGPNGNPKQLLRFLPPDYPLLNFVLVSVIYVFISYRIFNITNALKNIAIPPGKDGAAKLKQNLLTWPVAGACVYLVGLFVTILA